MSKYSIPTSRMKNITMSGGIREILSRANELESQGRSIIHMEIGRPDFDSPVCAKEAARIALDSGDVHYTEIAGTYELRRAIAQKYSRDNGFFVDENTNVIVTAGSIEAIMISLISLLEPGDEVIVPSPFFPAYADQISLAGLSLKTVPCSMVNSFCLKIEDLESAITARTKLLIINTPNNPSGAVLSREDLVKIADLAVKNDFWVISDECYEKFLYEGEHVSIASLPGMKERTITVSSSSKTWSMTGWRVGWGIFPNKLSPYANKVHQNFSTCANSFAQAGVTGALINGDSDVVKMIAEYKLRRDLAMEWMKKITSLECSMPRGAFYLFPNIEKIGMNGFDFCSLLLEEAGVAAVPGEVFYAPGFFRIAYCRGREEINEGMSRIADLLNRI